MEEKNHEEYILNQMSVQEMSKKVLIGLFVLAFAVLIMDIIISKNSGTNPWIVRYMSNRYSKYFFASKTSAAPATETIEKKVEAAPALEESNIIDESEVNNEPLFDTEGFLFEKSAEEYINEEELYNLQEVEGYTFKELLGFARNEIYARHGYPFKKDGVYYQHYSQYEWYNNMEHKTVKDGELNPYEIQNIKLIVSIEEKEGFR